MKKENYFSSYFNTSNIGVNCLWSLFLTLLICVKFSAQKLEVNPTSIFLKTTLEEYLDEPTEPSEIIENRYYRIISFSQPPDNSTKTRLMELVYTY